MARKRPDTRAGLLRAICEDPDADTPRLVFADWLDEHGGETERAWAEFIRLECALARLASNDSRQQEMRRRAAWLWNHHSHHGWRSGLPRGMADRGFRRGFPADIRSSTLNFLRQGKRLFETAPVETLELTRLEGHLDELLASPLLTPLRGLDLQTEPLGNEGAAKLAACSSLGQLTALNVSWCRIGDAGALALASSPLLTRLTTLELRHNDLSPVVRESLRQRFGNGLKL